LSDRAPASGGLPLAKVSALLRLFASSAFAVLSVSLLWASLPESWADEPEAPPRPLSLPGRSLALPPEATSAPVASGSPAVEEQALPPLGPRQILIDLGPPRSEVFVDGRRVGQTPFLGQVRCRPGREIQVQVIPERGFPLSETRVCPP
jgi:hypothetical protein